MRVEVLGTGSAKGLGYTAPSGKTVFTVLQTILTGCTETELHPVSLLGCVYLLFLQNWLYLRMFYVFYLVSSPLFQNKISSFS